MSIANITSKPVIRAAVPPVIYPSTPVDKPENVPAPPAAPPTPVALEAAAQTLVTQGAQLVDAYQQALQEIFPLAGSPVPIDPSLGLGSTMAPQQLSGILLSDDAAYLTAAAAYEDYHLTQNSPNSSLLVTILNEVQADMQASVANSSALVTAAAGGYTSVEQLISFEKSRQSSATSFLQSALGSNTQNAYAANPLLASEMLLGLNCTANLSVGKNATAVLRSMVNALTAIRTALTVVALTHKPAYQSQRKAGSNLLTGLKQRILNDLRTQIYAKLEQQMIAPVASILAPFTSCIKMQQSVTLQSFLNPLLSQLTGVRTDHIAALDYQQQTSNNFYSNRNGLLDSRTTQYGNLSLITTLNSVISVTQEIQSMGSLPVSWLNMAVERSTNRDQANAGKPVFTPNLLPAGGMSSIAAPFGSDFRIQDAGTPSPGTGVPVAA